MSKLANRTAIKDLSSLNVDCQYAYQLGIKVFSPEENARGYKELCDNFRTVCEDIEKELASVKSLIPTE